MCRPPRRAPLSLWVLAGVLTLLSVPLTTLAALVALAAPASADTVTPVRHCRHGGDYREVRRDSAVVVTAPDGYLIVSYCVDGRGRRSGSEVHALSSPQPTAVVRHSEGREIEGYAVEYTRVPASEAPEPDTDTDDPEPDGHQDDQGQDDQGDGDGDGATDDPDAGQSTPAEPEKTAAAAKSEKPERTSPTADPTPTPEPRRQASEAPVRPGDATPMTQLSDGEELRTTSLKAVEDDEEKDELRSLVVAGGIVIVGLLAGMVALLVRLPGQR